MDSLIKTLPAILQAAGDSDQVAEAACLAAWKHAAGAGLRDHAVPLRLNQKTLVVAVADTTWQKQLQSLSGQLLFRLNSILGQPLVTYFDFRVEPDAVGKVGRSRGAKQTDRERSEREKFGHGQYECEQAGHKTVSVELITAAAQIQDQGLRRAFLGAAISCLNRLERSQI